MMISTIRLGQLRENGSDFIVHSDAMKTVLQKIEKVARTSATVLLTGESGVGKEMVAKAIHHLGKRRDKPFVRLNCGAIPADLLESELFGYQRGAFTGADPRGKAGYFSIADGGVLFLDEIAELPLPLQVKLLRVLQEREVTPLGALQPQPVDVQIIAATNRDLERMVENGVFRKDLYYRLNVIPIHIPPLRDRIDDVPYLAQHFLQKFNTKYQRQVVLTPDALERLKSYPWLGNVRELENVIERIVVTSDVDQLDASAVEEFVPSTSRSQKNMPVVTSLVPLQDALDAVEEQLILMAMKQFKSMKSAAKALGISQPTMSRKYRAVQEKLRRSRPYLEAKERKFFEEELNKQLSTVAVVTSASLNVSEIKQLALYPSAENPVYHKLQRQLTTIREHEGKIEWMYIWKIEANKVIHLVADDKLKIEPGQEYNGPPEMMKAVYRAWNGSVSVTPNYTDRFGRWKSSLAPIRDESGQVVAILGSDYSADYVNTEIMKLSTLLDST
ncbi:MAG TPA: sigma 54-interacting transcriptional regulator [Alicyclobacillus sp.]|nr:sigma 54-interacting transcriptional regulator [Alicyclobacillus sp.]